MSGTYNLSGARAPYSGRLRPVRDGVHREMVTLSGQRREYPPTTIRFPDELVRAARAADWPLRVEVTGVGRYVVELADGETEWTTKEIPPMTTRVFAFLWMNQWLHALPPGADCGPGSDAYVDVGHAPVLLELPELETALLELELPPEGGARIGSVRLEGLSGSLFARGPSLYGAAPGTTVRFPVVWSAERGGTFSFRAWGQSPDGDHAARDSSGATELVLRSDATVRAALGADAEPGTKQTPRRRVR